MATEPKNQQQEIRIESMSDVPEYYADAIYNISFSGGMIRLDLASLQPNLANPSATPSLKLKGRVIIPVPAFIKLFDDSNGFLQQLEKSGIVGRNNTDTNMNANAAKKPS